MSEGQVPVRESVGAALRFVRENIQFVAAAAAIGALVSTGLAAIAVLSPQLGLVGSAISPIVQSFVYAALLGAVLFGAAAVTGRVGRDGWRVFGAMAVVGFFMFLVTFVISIPVFIVLLLGPMAPYSAALEAAGGDEAAVLEVMARFAQEQPMALLLTFLFYAILWFALTSRLYLAAPASAEQGRILTFETWSWTKGQTLRITAARLMLLAPAYVLVSALSLLIGRAVGIDILNPMTAAEVAQANSLLYLGFVFVSGLINLALYTALEAGLSSYLYRGLKPADTPPPAA